MNRKTLLAAALTGPLLVIPPPAWAQAADSWRFQAALNVYLPDIGGKTTLRLVGMANSLRSKPIFCASAVSAQS